MPSNYYVRTGVATEKFLVRNRTERNRTERNRTDFTTIHENTSYKVESVCVSTPLDQSSPNLVWETKVLGSLYFEINEEALSEELAMQRLVFSIIWMCKWALKLKPQNYIFRTSYRYPNLT